MVLQTYIVTIRASTIRAAARCTATRCTATRCAATGCAAARGMLAVGRRIATCRTVARSILLLAGSLLMFTFALFYQARQSLLGKMSIVHRKDEYRS